jgi:hypothetical protein
MCIRDRCKIRFPKLGRSRMLFHVADYPDIRDVASVVGGASRYRGGRGGECESECECGKREETGRFHNEGKN